MNYFNLASKITPNFITFVTIDKISVKKSLYTIIKKHEYQQ